jgi:hypothetical protein
MATHNIYQGGDKTNPVTNQMYPSGTVSPAGNRPYSYSDHQRLRSYGVTRRIDLRPRTPYGNGNTTQATRSYFDTTPILVGDVIRTHLLLPNTVLTGVSYGIEAPTNGFVFTLKTEVANTTLQAGINTTTVVTNAAGGVRAYYIPVANEFYLNQDYIDMVVTAVPAVPATLYGPDGLRMWVTAHVIDLDHGNN